MPFIEPIDMSRGKPLQGWSGSFFHSANMTFGLWEISADAEALHEHSHAQEEVWNIVEGRIALTVAGEERIVEQGSAVVIPPNALHSARPLGRCRVVVVDWPLRPDLPGSGHESNRLAAARPARPSRTAKSAPRAKTR